jgi:hypothetical protein
MSRTFDPASLVVLPVLSGSAAYTLGEELRTAAKDADVTPSVTQAFDRVIVTHEALRAVLGERLPTPAENTAEARKADRVLDSVYSGIYDWCRGLTKLPGDLAPGLAAKAGHIAETFFPEGLKFTQLPYKLQWADSQIRVDALTERKLAGLFEELNGSAFVTALKSAHEAYGKALGVTKSKPEPSDPPEVRKALDTFTESLRSYVVQVVAFADAGGPQAAKTGQTLLAPLAAWRSTSGTSKEEDAPPTPVVPTV